MRRSVSFPAALLTLAGCTVGADPAVDSEGGGAGVSWTVGEDTGVVSTLNVEEATVALDAVLRELPRLHAAPLFEVYDEVMTYADETCPLATTDPDGGSLWDSRCTAGSGAYFSGFIGTYHGSPHLFDEQSMRGEATVVLPDGRTFVVAGEAGTSKSEDGRQFQSEVDGVYSWNGEASEVALLSGGWHASLRWGEVFSPDGVVEHFEADGSVAPPEGALTAVDFAAVSFVLDELSVCTLEPSGTLALRDTAGVWHDLVFDVLPTGDGGLTVAEGACDGCGTVWDRGVDQGQICLDVPSLFSEMAAPW